jgi:hypothetical protein
MTRGSALLALVLGCSSGRLRPVASPDSPPPWPDAGPDGLAQSCAEESHTARRMPVDLVLLLDASGSMLWPAPDRPRWRTVNEAISTFVGDPESAGLGVGLQLYPRPPGFCAQDTDCAQTSPIVLCIRHGACPASADHAPRRCEVGGACADGSPCARPGRCQGSGADCSKQGADCPPGDLCLDPPLGVCVDGFETDAATTARICSADSYRTPAMPLADLPAAAPGVVSALFAEVPAGPTPMGPAVEGTLAYLRAAARGGRRPALVLTTDGLPEGCAGDDTDAVAALLAKARHQTPPILTFVIGVFDPAETTGRTAAATLALAGGTGAPIVATADHQLGRAFLDALAAIRGGLGCSFDIPAGSGPLDYGRVNLRVTDPAGQVDDVFYVGGVSRCDGRGGWYYDVDPATGGTPTRVIACEATCRRLRAEGDGARVELRFGCRTRVIE